MAAVCAEEHFAELIRKRPSNRERLMAIDPKEFIRIMQAWRAPFVAGAELPLIGTTEADLRSIRVPTCIIPGNDLTHGSATGERPRGSCPIARRTPWLVDQNVDIVPAEEWYKMADKIAAIFAEFLARKLPQAQPQAVRA